MPNAEFSSLFELWSSLENSPHIYASPRVLPIITELKQLRRSATIPRRPDLTALPPPPIPYLPITSPPPPMDTSLFTLLLPGSLSRPLIYPI